MKGKAGTYKYVGSHVGDLDSGQMLEIGEEVDLTSEQVQAPLAQAMLEEGLLIEAEEPPPAQTSKSTSKSKGEEG
jgi:hypothetical protein